MTWATRRQLLYLGILLALFLGLVFLVGYPYFNKPATCFDNKQNGIEAGVDCGGMCSLACVAQVDPISTLWARSFRVVPGRYNAVAYLENHNKSIAVERIAYRFRFADKDNTYIGKREGITYVPPAGKFAVFAPGINVGNSVPVYTTFEFTEVPVWRQIDPTKIDQLKMDISNIQLINEETTPNLSAVIKNNSLFDVPEITIIAILYDESHNALSVSSTYVEDLGGGESKNINFTWPELIPGKVITKEIFPVYNVFQVKLK